MPIITPEETSAIEPSSNDDPNVLDRLCEYEEEGISGCRRTQTMLALEEQYETFVSPEMRWGYWDLFCEHNGLLYYDRNQLNDIIANDLASAEADVDNVELQEYIRDVNAKSGRTWYLYTKEKLDELVKSDTRGLPVYVDETDRFYRFEDVGVDMLTAQNMTKEKLDIIRETFTDDVNPLLMDLEGSIYFKDSQAYCTNFFLFNENPNAKLGAMIEDLEENVMKFFPFEPLTDDEKDFVVRIAQAEREMEVEIIEL